jgi:hypothetical protein
MNITNTAREALEVSLVDARYWLDRAVSRLGEPTDERREFWQNEVLVLDIASEVLERALDRHYASSCHPDSDCDHEEPSLGLFLMRIPRLVEMLVDARTSNLVLTKRVTERLLSIIGAAIEDSYHEALSA